MYLTGDMALPPLTIDGITTADAMICLLTHDDMNSPMGRHKTVVAKLHSLDLWDVGQTSS